MQAENLNEKISETLMWIEEENPVINTHTAFRGCFSLKSDLTLDLLVTGASWYTLWLDGNELIQGPDRYHPSYPEYQKIQIKVSPGEHVLSAQVHYAGVETRIQKVIHPFLFCLLKDNSKEISINWKVKRLNGYFNHFRRIVGNLGWIEWCDLKETDPDWRLLEYDDTSWQKPVFVRRKTGSFKLSCLSPVKKISVDSKLIDKGELAEIYGVFNDFPGSTFFTRDNECKNYPPEGVWFRFDLGKVMLSRADILLDIPEGTIVEIGHSEYLLNGRVSPWIATSGSDTCNVFRYIARNGLQRINPVIPMGGRYVEIHIMAPEKLVDIKEVSFSQRCYWDKAEGSFFCSDKKLNEIWKIGVETMQSCSEDSVIDNPTRERGQWIGDYIPTGMNIVNVAFSDNRLIRRALVQAVQSANADGIAQAQSPGHESYIPSFAMTWITGCLDYWKMTGDKSIIEDLHPYAVKNIDAFDEYWTEEGLITPFWNFIDWGYSTNEGPSDMALNIFYLIGIYSMVKWEKALGNEENAKKYIQKATIVKKTILKWLNSHKTDKGYDYKAIGYDRTVLAVLAGLFTGEEMTSATEAMKKHNLDCFPNNPDAPRLRTSNPSFSEPRLITPYFSGFAFPIFFDNNEEDFVFEQYKKCWGWGIDQGLTTWMEVYDLRWSHCHHWSGSPTWQLSRYVLGLHPAFDEEINLFDFKLSAGELEYAGGRIPLPSGKFADIKWERKESKIVYKVDTQEPLKIRMVREGKTKIIKVLNSFSFESEKQNGEVIYDF